MAFGLGFDKAKILRSAEKYVVQGKFPAAIEEYNKILRKDPKDLMALNTVGDLYDRVGNTEEALKCFYPLAEKSIEAGFLPRAIAIYKRITKIEPNSATAYLKLGELYSMQGLLRDSRMHYLHAVEIFLKAKDKEKAREVFEKVLLLDMENPRLQLQMAELYADTGKKEDAIATYLGAAERFLDRSEPAEAGKAVAGLLKLDPGNAEAKTLQSRIYLEQGDAEKAIETLEAIPSGSSRKEVLHGLLQAYRKQGDTDKAREIASQLSQLHQDFSGLALISEEMLSQRDVEGAWKLYQGLADHLANPQTLAALTEGLRKILSAEPSHLGALELLARAQQQAGSSGEAQETIELLAHAYVTHGLLEKARELLAKLVAMEPENPDHRRLLRQVESRMGADVEAEGLGAVAPMIAEVVAGDSPSPVKVETLPPREQALVKNCLTESELYITYHQIGRAIETLEGGLAQVPGNPTLCEHLLPLYEQSEQYEKAASCAEALTEEYVKLGDGERASRYGELTLTLQQKAMENALPPAGIVGAAPSSASASTLPAPELPSPASELPSSDLAAYEPAPPEPAATEQSQVREVDLSMEWASAGTEEASPATAADGTAEEIEFYLQAGLVSEAVSALERLQEQFPSHSAIEGFRERLAALQGDAVPAVETPAAEPAPDAAPTADAWTQTAATPPMVEPAVSAEFTAAAPEPSTVSPERTPVEVGYGEVGGKIGDESVATQPTVEPTPGIPAPAAAESGQEFVFEEISHSPASAFELALEESHAAESVAAAPPGDPLAALAGELGESLDLPEAPSPAGAAPPAAVAATPAVPVKEAAPAPQEKPQGGLLDDIFAEFKEEMEEPAAAGDLETHYNMGVAFKEMALYDEAIGEFQKMHQLAEKAKDYSYLVQCCSLLATCFLEKGLPQLAVKWYQTALNSPGISPETSLALLFEIGSAYEVAGDRQAALRSFMEVYARNIDYRNVAERIRDLQQGA